LITEAIGYDIVRPRFLLFQKLQVNIMWEFLLDLLWLVVGFVLLVKGADWFVDGSAGIAARMGIPQLIIGLTIVAMGTSAPEAAVSISAAFKGSADITIGNIVGSNIMNILVILGLASVIVPIAIAKSTIRIEAPFMIAITALLLVLGLDGNIALVDGIILLVAFVAYLTYLFICAKKNPAEEEEAEKKPVWKLLLFMVVGLAAIVLGSNLAVDGATGIAHVLGLSERFIGLTIVALGTSLPELFTSVSAARKGNADIAIGNVVGSNIFNILLVVGVSSVIIPVPFAAGFIVDIAVSIAAGVLLIACCLSKKKLTRVGGIIMLVSYAAYFAYLLLK